MGYYQGPIGVSHVADHNMVDTVNKIGKRDEISLELPIDVWYVFSGNKVDVANDSGLKLHLHPYLRT